MLFKNFLIVAFAFAFVVQGKKVKGDLKTGKSKSKKQDLSNMTESMTFSCMCDIPEATLVCDYD